MVKNDRRFGNTIQCSALTFWGVIAACLATTISMGCADTETGPRVIDIYDSSLSFDSVAHVSAHPVSGERRFVDAPRLVDEFTINDSSGIGMVSIILTVGSERLIISDPTQATVLLVDREMNIIADYSGGAGRGPGELLNPTSVALDDDMNVYIADSYNRKVEVYDIDGTYVRSLALDYQPYRIAISGDLLAVSVFSPEYVFRTYSVVSVLNETDPDYELHVRPELKNSRVLPLLVGGEISISNGVIYHGLNFFPVMVAYDRERPGLRLFKLQDVHDTLETLLETVTSAANEFSRAPSERFVASMTVFKDTLYIHSWDASSEDNMVIDRYHINGDYIDSIAVDVDRATGFGIQNDELVIVADQGQKIVRYSIHPAGTGL